MLGLLLGYAVYAYTACRILPRARRQRGLDWRVYCAVCLGASGCSILAIQPLPDSFS